MQTALTNDITGQQIGKVSTTSLNSGVGSPFPSDSTPPVPSVGVTLVGPDVQEYVYMTGDEATVTLLDSSTAFKGSVASVTDGAASGLASMSIDHITSALNQEIKTLPITSSGVDSGYGVGILRGALTHWFSECGLFPDGIKGNVQMGIVNAVPGIGYYRQDALRYLGIASGASTAVQWVPTETAVVDQGISFEVGESLRLVFGLKIPLTDTATYSAQLRFAAAVATDTGSEDVGPLVDPNLYLVYNSSTGVLTLTERATGSTDKAVFNVSGVVKGNVPLFAEVTMLRTGVKSVNYGLRVVYQVDVTETTASSTISSSYVPHKISAARVDLASVRTNSGITSGIKSFYITKDGSSNDKDTWQERGVSPSILAVNKTPWNYTTVPGTSGSGWQLVNDLASAYGMYFDPLTITLDIPDKVPDNLISSAGHSAITTTAQVRELAETIEVVNYDYVSSKTPSTYIQLFKADTAYSLVVGERQEHIVQTEATFSRLLQPVCMLPDTVSKEINNENYDKSAYSVIDSGNLKVLPASWVDAGGFISVESTGTPGELKIVIQAPTVSSVSANWPLVITFDGGNPSLLIAGVGAKPRKKTITSYTGAGQGINIKKLGTTYDSPLIAKDSQAWEVAMMLGVLYGTTRTTINANLVSDLPSSYALPHVLHKGATYLPISWSKAGAVTSVSSAIRLTSCGTVNAEYANMTCGEYNALFAGKTIRYENISPLQTRRA